MQSGRHLYKPVRRWIYGRFPNLAHQRGADSQLRLRIIAADNAFFHPSSGTGWSRCPLRSRPHGNQFFFVLCGLSHHPHRRFGLANTVTAIRTGIVSLVAATVLFASELSTVPVAIWSLVLLVLLALILDGVDGYLARALSQSSALGARFDMEIDALLILVLSIAGLILGKAGWWVLAIGLMRYGFVFAQVFFPKLGGPLPPSFRRKLICVVQVAALCLILVPFVVPPVSTFIALFALLLLAYSFAVDTHYLLQTRRVT